MNNAESEGINLQTVTTEQALKNAIASSDMEGLIPTAKELELILKYVSGKISHEEFLKTVKAECQRI